ncbi:MAG: hypothetical protein ACXAC7_14535, partial [Candidatus Hodarchaeales archaeon]
MDFKIRNYNDENDIVSQVAIYNTLMKEMNPDANEAKVEDVKERYKDENWKPTQVHYLVNANDEVVGYAGFAFFRNTIALGYPYIKAEHRTQERMQELYNSHVAEAKKIKADRVLVSYNPILKPIHEFFAKQEYKTKSESFFMKVETEKLNQNVPGYEIKNFTKERIKDVADFMEKNKDDARPALSDKMLTDMYDNDQIKPESHFIVEKEGEIKGIVGAGLPDRPPEPDEENPVQAFLSFYAVEKDNLDKDLRKALTFALYPFLKANNIETYGSGVMADSPSKTLF